VVLVVPGDTLGLSVEVRSFHGLLGLSLGGRTVRLRLLVFRRVFYSDGHRAAVEKARIILRSDLAILC